MLADNKGLVGRTTPALVAEERPLSYVGMLIYTEMLVAGRLDHLLTFKGELAAAPSRQTAAVASAGPCCSLCTSKTRWLPVAG